MDWGDRKFWMAVAIYGVGSAIVLTIIIAVFSEVGMAMSSFPWHASFMSLAFAVLMSQGATVMQNPFQCLGRRRGQRRTCHGLYQVGALLSACAGFVAIFSYTYQGSHFDDDTPTHPSHPEKDIFHPFVVHQTIGGIALAGVVLLTLMGVARLGVRAAGGHDTTVPCASVHGAMGIGVWGLGMLNMCLGFSLWYSDKGGLITLVVVLSAILIVLVVAQIYLYPSRIASSFDSAEGDEDRIRLEQQQDLREVDGGSDEEKEGGHVGAGMLT